MNITIRNNFHGTETSLRVPARGEISMRTARRIANDLCGIRGCTCGGEVGQRGPQRTDDGRLIVVAAGKYDFVAGRLATIVIDIVDPDGA